MNHLRFEGTLIVGPATVSDSAFPAAESTVPFAPVTSPKLSVVNTGIKHRQVNSPNAYVALSGVGTGDDVTRADTFYAKNNAPMKLRLTFAQPGTDDLVTEVPLYGTKLEEYPSDQYLKLIEIKGVGLVEYFASGQV